MKCSMPMRHLGPVDIAPLAAALAAQPESLWTADVAFQKRLAPYRQTQTIYLMMTVGGVNAPTQRMAGWEPLHQAFEPLAERIANFYPGPGRTLNAQLALLMPRGEIPEHVDCGPVPEATHRVHVPLETHPDALFMVEGKIVALAVGQAYELDNIRPHSVHNRSPRRRIHLIIDYYEEPVAESTGA